MGATEIEWATEANNQKASREKTLNKRQKITKSEQARKGHTDCKLTPAIQKIKSLKFGKVCSAST